MLFTFLIATLTLTGTLAPDSSDARAEAADILRFTLEAVDRQEGDVNQLPRMLAAGEAAAETLGPGLLADGLREAVGEARARQSTEPGAAASRLEDTLRRALADLEFEPIMEAELPEGFPAPTPVGEIELKHYPLYRVARAESGGNAAFWQLFMHIQKHDIPMTAPVEMTYDTTGDEVDMAFMYEHAAQGQTGPDETVEVLDIEPMLVASVGCRGWSSEAAVDAAREQLSAWIDAQDELVVAGPVRQFGYNGPSVPGSKRYFEVQIPVRQVGGPAAADVGARESGGG